MSVKIAVIGSNGTIGSAITNVLVRSGSELFIYDHNVDMARELKREIQLHTELANIMVSASAHEAAAAADIIIPAISFQQRQVLACAIKEAVRDKIVICISNPLNAALDGLLTSESSSAAEELATLLPEAHVVKALNTVFAADYESITQEKQDVVNFIAADHYSSAETVQHLLKRSGFNTFYVGPLSCSRALEQMTLLLLNFPNRLSYNWLSECQVSDAPVL